MSQLEANVKVTPLDLKKADFKRVLRGFDPNDVGDLLAAAAETLEEMVRENRSLKEKQNMLGERLKSYESMEKTLNDTLITAQKSGDATRQVAEREAELIVAKAEVQAEKLVEGAKSELKKLRYQIEMLDHEKEAFLVKMRSLVASQWKILQEDFEPRRSVFQEPERPSDSEEIVADPQTPAPVKLPLEAVPEPEEVENGAEIVDEADLGVGDLSGQLGKILGSSGEDALPGADSAEGDGFSLGGKVAGGDDMNGEIEEFPQQPGSDKPEVFWGDETPQDESEADKDIK
jgi:cell division initiation protein